MLFAPAPAPAKFWGVSGGGPAVAAGVGVCVSCPPHPSLVGQRGANGWLEVRSAGGWGGHGHDDSEPHTGPGVLPRGRARPARR